MMRHLLDTESCCPFCAGDILDLAPCPPLNYQFVEFCEVARKHNLSDCVIEKIAAVCAIRQPWKCFDSTTITSKASTNQNKIVDTTSTLPFTTEVHELTNFTNATLPSSTEIPTIVLSASSDAGWVAVPVISILAIAAIMVFCYIKRERIKQLLEDITQKRFRPWDKLKEEPEGTTPKTQENVIYMKSTEEEHAKVNRPNHRLRTFLHDFRRLGILKQKPKCQTDKEQIIQSTDEVQANLDISVKFNNVSGSVTIEMNNTRPNSTLTNGGKPGNDDGSQKPRNSIVEERDHQTNRKFIGMDIQESVSDERVKPKEEMVVETWDITENNYERINGTLANGGEPGIGDRSQEPKVNTERKSDHLTNRKYSEMDMQEVVSEERVKPKEEKVVEKVDITENNYDHINARLTNGEERGSGDGNQEPEDSIGGESDQQTNRKVSRMDMQECILEERVEPKEAKVSMECVESVFVCQSTTLTNAVDSCTGDRTHESRDVRDRNSSSQTTDVVNGPDMQQCVSEERTKTEDEEAIPNANIVDKLEKEHSGEM